MAGASLLMFMLQHAQEGIRLERSENGLLVDVQVPAAVL